MVKVQFTAICPKCGFANSRNYTAKKLPQTCICDQCGERFGLGDALVLSYAKKT